MRTVIVIAMLSLCSCISKDQIGASHTGAAAIAPIVQKSSSAANKIFNEALISKESFRYVSGELTWVSRTSDTCSTTVLRETSEFTRRAAAFEIQQAYFKSIVDGYNKPLPTENVRRKLFDAIGVVNALALNPIDKAQITALNLLAQAAENIWRQVDLAERRRVIAQEARKKHHVVEKVVSDLISGFVSLDKDIAANIKHFEQCEYEKLIYIRDNDNLSKLDLERRYADFMRQKIAYKGFSVADENIKNLLQKIVLAHKALFTFEPKDAEAVLDQIMAAVDYLDRFKQSVEDYDKVRDQFVELLRKGDGK